MAEYEDRMVDPSFWNDSDKAQEVINEANQLKSVYNTFNKLSEMQEDLEVMYELVKEEAESDFEEELNEKIEEYKQVLSEYELTMLLSEPHDKNNAILEIHPGAGGTESQDWGSILLRMYMRWADDKGFAVETLDYQAGDEAGIKSVTLLIKGLNAYGYLRSERGVHRLVRISPFDSAGRRHTSFCSIDVMPEIAADNNEIEVDPDDLRIDTYRASGAGGQHINKTSSAIRITHIPTGIVVQSQSQRSQFQNRDTAMGMLKAKLFQRQEEEREKELAAIRGEQKEIGWGSQIRSYVFHPYSMVKDHRTNYETGNTQAVVDGDLDGFIDAYLKMNIDSKE
ncbi:peptide chain release factor 2 [Jeotgalibaca ciconiae]|uniref:Peptide chain release factor 2 n=1 Tax=Jeotgalibaca ciconiae TaxID=2496265 RepID=A0A3Q9BKP7_9LACT|nr:peptide chain release factor 2 [Jeotgalibaca ciconiae]